MNFIPSELIQYTLENYLVNITTRSKVIYWIIIGTIILILVILPFVHVDVSIQARGFFQSDLEKQFINAPFEGKIIYSSILTGKEIKKGDTLLVIDSESIRAQKEIFEKKIIENNLSISDLRRLTSMIPDGNRNNVYDLGTARYISEYASFCKQHQIQLQKLLKTESEYNRNKILFDQKLISTADFENNQYYLSSERENLNRIFLSQKSSWQTDLSLRKLDSVAFAGEFLKLQTELDNRIVKAPVDGEIIKSSEIQAGSFVLANQEIMEISPGGDLLGVCFVKPSDIGLVYENQPVIIQVDAFNHNEWGMIRGSIIDISDDMIVDGNSNAYFRIKCKLEKRILSLKNGYKAEMKKGMSLNARLIVARRSLFNLLFDKIDKWFNPYMSAGKTTANES